MRTGTPVAGQASISGQWCRTDGIHWAVVHEPKENARAEIRLYVDGKLLQTAGGYPQPCGPGDLLIGKARTPEGDELFNGLIDEVRIYNRVLTASEIAELASQE